MASFSKGSTGTRRHRCDKCSKRGGYRLSKEESKERASERLRTHRHSSICRDSRKSDKRHGRAGNDLDLEFVRDLIQKDCHYCGTRLGKMTLDRVDNDKAHTKDNVVPCCVRCNSIRNDMPYAAWMELVPTIRELTEKGVFGDWKLK